MKPVISVIVPIFNEEKIIAELYNRIQKTIIQISDNYEIIFVNDGSKDHSFLELLKLAEIDKRVFYINFSRNFGHQIAVTAGVDAAKGAAVVIIDGDLQDPPELILEMYAKHKEGFEVVYAKRAERKGETFFKKFTAKIFYRTLKKLTSVDIPLDTGDYRLMDEKIVHYLKQMPEQNKFLRGQIAWLGFRQTAVLFNRDERKYGKTGYTLSKMLKFAMDGITSFSDKPIQFVTRLGFITFFVAVSVMIYALYNYFFRESTVTGWTSIMISTLFIGSVQLISIGVIGEYISRINKNVQNRPLYIVQETNTTSTPS